MTNHLDFNSEAVGFNFEFQADTKQKMLRIDNLRRQFIDLYSQRDAMLINERDDVFCRYVELVGRRKYENLKLSIRLRAMRLKAELAQAAINRNQLPDMREIDREVRGRLKEYYADLHRQRKAITDAEKATRISAVFIDELKGLYRVLVRRLHPDLHPDLPEWKVDLFIKGQAAYRSYDIDTLREVIKRLDMEEDLGEILQIGETLDEAIERLEADVECMQSEIRSLRNSFPFNLESNLLDPVWVEEQQRLLQQEHVSLTEQLKIYSQRVNFYASL